jgi:hypothetical protein
MKKDGYYWVENKGNRWIALLDDGVWFEANRWEPMPHPPFGIVAEEPIPEPGLASTVNSDSPDSRKTEQTED